MMASASGEIFPAFSSGSGGSGGGAPVKVKRRSGPKSKTSPYIGVTQYKKTLR